MPRIWLGTRPFAHALACHLDETEFGHAENLARHAALGARRLESLEHARDVLRIAQMDEIDHDQPADAAQSELAADRLRRFDVHLQACVLETAAVNVTSGIDVDRG